MAEKMKERVEYAAKLLDQLEMVRMSGKTNMASVPSVMNWADHWGFSELVVWLASNENSYLGLLNAMGELANSRTNAEREELKAQLREVYPDWED